jgi:hypothetical protein
LASHTGHADIAARRRALTVEMIHKIGEAWKFRPTFLFVPTKSSWQLEQHERWPAVRQIMLRLQGIAS